MKKTLTEDYFLLIWSYCGCLFFKLANNQENIVLLEIYQFAMVIIFELSKVSTPKGAACLHTLFAENRCKNFQHTLQCESYPPSTLFYIMWG